MSRKVHLVLGSGGARGIAHIGVIEMLEQGGYEIASVTGCSMGAVVGGMYCAGYLPAYKNWLLTLTKSKVFGLLDFTLAKQGFVKGEKILSRLQEFTGEQQIEKMKIPFTAVATDMLNKKEVYFNSGNLYKALRASIGIPGVFTPVIQEEALLVDGGVLNPLPLNLVRKNKNELIIAVNLNGHSPVLPAEQTSTKEDQELSQHPNSWLGKIFNSSKKADTPPSALSGFSVFDLLNTSYDFTQDKLTELMIRFYPPDVLIEIPRNTCSVFEFHRANELIERGKQAYKDALKKIEI